MTRRHIEAIAAALKAVNPDRFNWPLRTWQHELDCASVANALKDINPSFDVARFLRDCGVKS